MTERYLLETYGRGAGGPTRPVRPDRLTQGLRRVLAETRPADEARRLEGFVDTFVQVGTALEWATFAIRDRPQIERVIEIGRALLRAHGPVTQVEP